MRRYVVALIGLAVFIGACGNAASHSPTGIVRDPAPDVSAISLPDASDGDRPFSMRADSGEVLMVYFGYTECPDVCPTTLADLRSAVRRMGDEGDRIDVAMITVDPGRDDAERLTAYVQGFFDGGHALRTDDDAQLQTAADVFGALYEVVTSDDGGIEVGHTAYLYGIDSAGLIRMQWPFGVTSEDLELDLLYLLEEGT